MADERRPQDEPQDEAKDEVLRAEASAKELSAEDLDKVAGGGSAIADVIKTIGEAAATAARKG